MPVHRSEPHGRQKEALVVHPILKLSVAMPLKDPRFGLAERAPGSQISTEARAIKFHYAPPAYEGSKTNSNRRRDAR